MSAIALRQTVAELCEQRIAALMAYQRAYDAAEQADAEIRNAHELARRVSPGEARYNFHNREEVKAFYEAVKLPKREDYLATARRLVDTDVWSWVIQRTELERLMDKKAKDEFNQKLLADPDEAIESNILAMLQRFAGEADMIWKRGIAETFAKLDRRFRSHDGWKIGSRVILTYCFDDCGHWSYHSAHSDTLRDIERTFLILDGKDAKHRYSGIVEQIEEERKGGLGKRRSQHEANYFRMRIFENGNAHLWMKRDDLVRDVNKLLGEYYDDAIGDQENVPTDEDILNNPRIAVAKNYGFFPTPPAAAEKVIERASIYRGRDVAERLTVLEPSAGTGNLAKIAAGKEAVVDCVEMQPHLVTGLNLQGLYRKVYQSDFLRLQPATTGLYDRIIMNPPFDRERDIDHVVHALKFLKADGILVAIMSAGTEFRETKKSVAFRQVVDERGGWFVDLPEKSFAEVGTYVNTLMCVIGRKNRW